MGAAWPEWFLFRGHSSPDRAARAKALQTLPLTGWLLAAACGWCGLTEAQVRPVRRREIIAGKFLFLLLWLWLPQAASLLLVWRVNGLSWPDAWHSLAAFGGVFVPLWTLALATGRLAGSFRRWAGMAGVLAALAAFIGLWSPRFTMALGVMLSDAWGASCGPVLWGFTAVTSGVLLMMLALRAVRWKLPVRILTVCAVILSSAFFWHRGVWFKSNDQPGAGFTVAQLEAIQPVPASDGLTGSLEMEASTVHFSPKAEFGTANLPPGVFCYWQRRGDAALYRGSERVASSELQNTTGRPEVTWLFPPPGTPMDNASLKAALPPDAQLSRSAPQWDPFGKSPAQLGRLTLEPGAYLSDADPVSLEVGLMGILYRHDLVADVPLGTAHSASYEGLNLNIRRMEPGQTRLPRAEIAVIGPAQGYGPDPLKLNWRMGPFRAWRVFLYLPKSGQMFPSSDNPMRRSGPVLGGALLDHQVLEFGESIYPRDYSPEDLAGARIFILTPRLLGFAERLIRTPEAPVRLFNDPPRGLDFYTTLGPALAPRDFFQWARSQQPDPATATRDQLGEWLRVVLAQHTLDDWQQVELARWVPRHMETLLRIEPYFSASQPPSMMAIARTLPESRKMEIIRRVPEVPKLVSVLIRRGWAQDARKELIDLLHSGRPLDENTVRCIAGLCEPSTWEALLRRLEQSPNTELYDILRLCDSIEPRLTETLRRYHTRVTIDGREPAGTPSFRDEQTFASFTIPARHGIAEALADHLAMVRWFLKEPGNDRLTDRVDEFVEFPPGVKPRTEQARGFLLNLKPEQCRWDPLTRMWLTQNTTP